MKRAAPLDRATLRPSGLLLMLAGFWVLFAVAVAAVPAARLPWIALGLGLLSAALGDAVLGTPRPDVSLRRDVPGAVPLGVWTRVAIELTNHGERPLRASAFDHYPATADLEGLPVAVAMPARGWARFEYRLRPRRRGDARFEPLELLTRSRLSLWERRFRVGEATAIRVLPNFRPLVGYATFAVENRLGDLGIRVRERRGEGREFRELRDFRQGDSLRQIDWKATSRRQKLIARDYQVEDNQQLVLAVDCGRRMRAEEDGIAHFDHVLNAVLLLGYAAVRHGDAVSLLTFGGGSVWVPPRKGQAAVHALLSALYGLETTTEPPDYLAAAHRLETVQRRRALVVLVSNLRDEDASELLPALSLLRRRHVVLFANLREKALFEAAKRPIRSLPDALLAGATRHYLEARESAHQQVKSLGVLTLDVEPDQLPVAMVNRYLEVKRSGQL